MSEPPLEKKRLWAEVRGRVQGVGFRQYVFSHANRLGLTGWVRNDSLRYDRVEVQAEGTKGRLEALLDLLHKGPSSSYVTGVSEYWSEATGEYDIFEIRYR